MTVLMKDQQAAMKLVNVFVRIILKETLVIIAWTTSLVTQNAKVILSEGYIEIKSNFLDNNLL